MLVRKRMVAIGWRSTHIFICPARPRRVWIHVRTGSESIIVIRRRSLRWHCARRWRETGGSVLCLVWWRCILTPGSSELGLWRVLVGPCDRWRKAGRWWVVAWLTAVRLRRRRRRNRGVRCWIVSIFVRIASGILSGACCKSEEGTLIKSCADELTSSCFLFPFSLLSIVFRQGRCTCTSGTNSCYIAASAATSVLAVTTASSIIRLRA